MIKIDANKLYTIEELNKYVVENADVTVDLRDTDKECEVNELEEWYSKEILGDVSKKRHMGLDTGKPLQVVSIKVMEDVNDGEIKCKIESKIENVASVQNNVYSISNGERVYCTKIYSDNIEGVSLLSNENKLLYSVSRVREYINMDEYKFYIVKNGINHIDVELQGYKSYYKGTNILGISSLSEEEVLGEVITELILKGVLEDIAVGLKKGLVKKGTINRVIEFSVKDGRGLMVEDYDIITSKEGVEKYYKKSTDANIQGVNIYKKSDTYNRELKVMYEWVELNYYDDIGISGLVVSKEYFTDKGIENNEEKLQMLTKYQEVLNKEQKYYEEKVSETKQMQNYISKNLNDIIL